MADASKMDVLRLGTSEREDPAAGIVDAVEISVNGRDLRDLVAEAELPFARREVKPRLAGSYVGLPPEEMFLPSRRLLGEPGTYYDADYADGRLAVLGCVCGEVGCWPLLVGISVGEDVVTWEDFRQPHGGAWRYGVLGPFVFGRGAYEAELRGASASRM